MNRIRRAARSVQRLRRWDRDFLALAAIACIAIGLSSVSVALSWLAVGMFLFVAASGSRKGGA